MGTEYESKIEDYLSNLAETERSKSTRRQYRREVLCFLEWLGERPVNKENAVAYKEQLEQAYRPSSVNAKLSALNSFFAFLGRRDLHLRLVKIQRKVYRQTGKELTRGEYVRLVRTAEREGNRRLSLLIQTICATGIRVSELKFITAEAMREGEAHIGLKGKNRTILLPQKLRRSLQGYMADQKITSGPVFVTRTGRPLDRSNIWKMMKALCRRAGVSEDKVFPHNLRHLFARCFYAVDRDIAKLADILGHSSINTTRIYLMTTGAEHRRCLDSLGLVISGQKKSAPPGSPGDPHHRMKITT